MPEIKPTAKRRVQPLNLVIVNDGQSPFSRDKRSWLGFQPQPSTLPEADLARLHVAEACLTGTVLYKEGEMQKPSLSCTATGRYQKHRISWATAQIDTRCFLCVLPGKQHQRLSFFPKKKRCS